MAILVGTASWTDKSLVDCGRFYPPGCRSAEARLRYYASRFPMVEVDSSYYAVPAPGVTALWTQRTPAGFIFNIKAFRAFTGHATGLQFLHKDLQQALAPLRKSTLYYRDFPAEVIDELWRRFIEALGPLREAGRLKAVHFQFAPWMSRSREGIDHVHECARRMAGHVLSVEFRNASWFDGEHAAATLRMQREIGAAHTVVDGPQGFANSVPAVWEATRADLAVVRLHGRNSATWNAKGLTAASDRFNYDYPDEELETLAGQVRTLARRVSTVQVIFNNNNEDQGQRNATTMMGLLGVAPPCASAGFSLSPPPGRAA
jgi:uncharacterized protein YecE (DUF72 family)